MEKFTTHTGIGVPLRASNVDTDQIIPAVYLKRISRTGFEDALFMRLAPGPRLHPQHRALQQPAPCWWWLGLGTGSSASTPCGRSRTTASAP